MKELLLWLLRTHQTELCLGLAGSRDGGGSGDSEEAICYSGRGLAHRASHNREPVSGRNQQASKCRDPCCPGLFHSVEGSTYLGRIRLVAGEWSIESRDEEIVGKPLSVQYETLRPKIWKVERDRRLSVWTWLEGWLEKLPKPPGAVPPGSGPGSRVLRGVSYRP